MNQQGPVGIFVHHQGRGHATRAAAIANALAPRRAVILFSARDDIFPALHADVTIVRIASLFEPSGGEPVAMSALPTPATLHCAPLGWAGITSSIATITDWFERARPSLFVTDVSAELGQLARIASIPHVAVLQHGDRSDPGHMASYDAAVGLLAPYARVLEQPDRTDAMRAKTHYAPGVGIDSATLLSRSEARRVLGVAEDMPLVLVLAGGGGQGTPTAPLTLGARAEPEARWVVIGETYSEWHETPPGNLELKGWVDNAPVWIAAADRIVSSCGNTTVHQVLTRPRPWIVIPEWRYFGEQHAKAEALGRAGVCATQAVWPAQAADWALLWQKAEACTQDGAETFVNPDAAEGVAIWLDELANRLWQGTSLASPKECAA